MGHKPWDRPWKRIEKARAKRRWKVEAGETITMYRDTPPPLPSVGDRMPVVDASGNILGGIVVVEADDGKLTLRGDPTFDAVEWSRSGHAVPDSHVDNPSDQGKHRN